jgi:hypothetical protein
MNLGGPTSLMGILMVVFLGKDLGEDLGGEKAIYSMSFSLCLFRFLVWNVDFFFVFPFYCLIYCPFLYFIYFIIFFSLN